MVEQFPLSDEELASFVRVSEVLKIAMRAFLLAFINKKLSPIPLSKCFVKQKVKKNVLRRVPIARIFFLFKYGTICLRKPALVKGVLGNMSGREKVQCAGRHPCLSRNIKECLSVPSYLLFAIIVASVEESSDTSWLCDTFSPIQFKQKETPSK